MDETRYLQYHLSSLYFVWFHLLDVYLPSVVNILLCEFQPIKRGAAAMGPMMSPLLLFPPGTASHSEFHPPFLLSQRQQSLSFLPSPSTLNMASFTPDSELELLFDPTLIPSDVTKQLPEHLHVRLFS